MEEAARGVLSIALEIASREGDLEDALFALVHASPRDGATLADAINLAVQLGVSEPYRDRAVSLLRGARATGLFD